MPRNGTPHSTALSKLIRTQRNRLGLSLAQLERRTGLHNSRLSRWERGLETPDRPTRLVALAKGLELPLADLYLAAGLEPAEQLPSCRSYLTAKYGQVLPAEAIEDIAQHAETIAERYQVDLGPNPGLPDPTPAQQRRDRRRQAVLAAGIRADIAWHDASQRRPEGSAA